MIMGSHRQEHDESGIKKSSPGVKFSRNFFVFGMLIAMLVLISGVTGESNTAVPIVSNYTITNQPQDIITVLATQAQSVIASLTTEPTLVPSQEVAAAAATAPEAEAAASRTIESGAVQPHSSPLLA